MRFAPWMTSCPSDNDHRTHHTLGKFWVAIAPRPRPTGTSGCVTHKFVSILIVTIFKSRIAQFFLLPFPQLKSLASRTTWAWVWDWVGRGLRWKKRRGYGQEVYETPEKEQEYWDSARGYRRQLQKSDARFQHIDRCVDMGRGGGWMKPSNEVYDDIEATIPVITAYQPALPPTRFSKQGKGKRDSLDEGTEYVLPSKTFCKWHRMVYPPSSQQLTLSQASKLRYFYSNRDRREMRRITRLLPNRVVFDPRWKWTTEYRDMWMRWLEGKGHDICIVFQDDESQNQSVRFDLANMNIPELFLLPKAASEHAE
ncbi:hypothetical protein E1B28_003724 [Marasmius oreades]|uniref:Uncharacterized protein n=1 Tax=Marasmius oreades TaxID=181124 RepID=A0A9P7UX19_9AGAR|nr:uncharacterized protein E1B28_003724 [Marasmius oreades]KAG7096276.1 hypothetical protein E1B28_003724 [Marasmius oreades]